VTMGDAKVPQILRVSPRGMSPVVTRVLFVRNAACLASYNVMAEGE